MKIQTFERIIMCKGKNICSELGDDPKSWDEKSTLLPPFWIRKEIETFISAVESAFRGDLSHSKEILKTIKSDDLRDWFVDHGQNTGKFRNAYFQNKKENIIPKEELEEKEKRISSKYEKEVLERDYYTCQYCGGKLIPNEVLKAFSKLIGVEDFSYTGNTNADRHGIHFYVKPTIDHVIPWNMGGLGNPKNFVASCWGCNFGKAGWSLKQLGLDDPMKNHFKNDDWKGLKELLYLPEEELINTEIKFCSKPKENHESKNSQVKKSSSNQLKTKNISFNESIVEWIFEDESREEICTRKFNKGKGGETVSKQLGIGIYYNSKRWSDNKDLEKYLRKLFTNTQNPFEAFSAFAKQEVNNPNSKVVYDFTFKG
ncbi:hypothetical protein LNTAR_15212 [Lentisphaera araneosa HTCC2155]|uniref:HNH domain-containing protein n=1 Tax=Lentisphaera araneosa HTCC2155 TaxID=313628 RepID=A6DRG7_9BACT|nr:HNH endonuclease [Lentisphaera araneosa]EDM25777.1 hypothetical protein LNTAR_15212 [Lentisphaera araneosa HTCC2155]